MKKLKEWFDTKSTRAAVVWLALAIAGIMVFSLFASLAQSNMGRIKVVNIYANIEGVGDNISMTLYLPKKADVDNQVPFVVATHGYLNNKEMTDLSYVELSRRGYAVVAVDGSVMGDYHGESGALGKSSGNGAGCFEVIEYFTQMMPDGTQMFPWLDFKRIGMVGHSMGAASTNSVMSLYAARETAAFTALKAKYNAAPYSFAIASTATTSGAIQAALYAKANDSANAAYKTQILNDINAALAQNKLRAALAMGNSAATSGFGLETVYGNLCGGRDEFFFTSAGASAAINNVNTQKKAIDEKNVKTFFPTTRKYATQYEFVPLYYDANPAAIALIGTVDPNYRLTGATIFGEAATSSLVYARPTLPRDLQAFTEAGISDPMNSSTASVVMEYKYYLSKQVYFDKLWKALRDWNAVDDHVKAATPTGTLSVLLPVQNADGTYSEGRLVNGGVYMRDGLKTDITWDNNSKITAAVDAATGLRPVFRSVFISQREIHPRNHFSKVTAANLNTFFMTAFGESPVSKLVAPTNQGWWWKEMFSFFAMICFLLMLVPVCTLLARAPFFKPAVQPVAQPTATLKKWYEWIMYLIPTAVIAVFSAISIPIIYSGAGYGMFSSIWSQSYFNQTTTNSVATWAFWNGMFGIAVFALMYWVWNRRRGQRMVNIGVKTPPGGIARSLIMAVAAVAIIFGMLGLVDYLFNVDFRLWTFAAKTFHSFKLGTAINYMFVFIFYYFSLALFTANNRWKNIPEWLSITMCVIGTVLGVVFMEALQYGGATLTGGFPQEGAAGNLAYIALFPIIPVLAFAAILSRKLYKVTGSVWLPAFVNTILFTIMSVTGTIVSGGWFRIFGL